jgi:hypothetical protein
MSPEASTAAPKPNATSVEVERSADASDDLASDRRVAVPAQTPSSDDTSPKSGAETLPKKTGSESTTRSAAPTASAAPAKAAATAPPHPSPAPRRPKPPTKGILKPPPPPAKPTLTNRLRDIVTVVGGGAKSLFDPQELETAGAGPSTPQSSVGGTLNALSGRLTLGLSRFVSPPGAVSTGSSPAASPVPRSMSLPEGGATGTTGVMSEKSRQKQPLKRATFLLPSLSITYPISSAGEPWSQKVLEDRKRVSGCSRATRYLG